jgi:hypothetical protein
MLGSLPAPETHFPIGQSVDAAARRILTMRIFISPAANARLRSTDFQLPTFLLGAGNRLLS